MVIEPYHRERAVAYAKRWAYGRNPLFPNFAGIGGDCTNFISQCVYAGCCTMNFSPVLGWYYISLNDRAPAWSGVEFFFWFLTQNQGPGPFGREVGAGELSIGDVIQLGREEGDFYHTLLVTGYANGTYLVAAHTDDSLNRRLDSYSYSRIRFLHIDGIQVVTPDTSACFENVLSGRQIGGEL